MPMLKFACGHVIDPRQRNPLNPFQCPRCNSIQRIIPDNIADSIAKDMALPVPDTAAQAVAERDAWTETAAQYSRNADYYRGLVIEIGRMLGLEACTADDGTVTPDVLCAKVPELVRKRLGL